MSDEVLRMLNLTRAICFDGEVDTRKGAVKGEDDRMDVADALNNVWAAVEAERRAYNTLLAEARERKS